MCPVEPWYQVVVGITGLGNGSQNALGKRHLPPGVVAWPVTVMVVTGTRWDRPHALVVSLCLQARRAFTVGWPGHWHRPLCAQNWSSPTGVFPAEMAPTFGGMKNVRPRGGRIAQVNAPAMVRNRRRRPNRMVREWSP